MFKRSQFLSSLKNAVEAAKKGEKVIMSPEVQMQNRIPLLLPNL